MNKSAKRKLKAAAMLLTLDEWSEKISESRVSLRLLQSQEGFGNLRSSFFRKLNKLEEEYALANRKQKEVFFFRLMGDTTARQLRTIKYMLMFQAFVIKNNVGGVYEMQDWGPK